MLASPSQGWGEIWAGLWLSTPSPPFTSAQDTPPWGMLLVARIAGGVRGSLPSLMLTLLADGVGEDLAHGCVVPGVSSTYRRIPDAAQGGSLDSWKGDGQLRGLRRQEPLLKLASRDSGVEMVVGDSLLATSPGVSQDSLDFEPTGSPEPLALASTEPPAHLGRLLANRKLEQVLERSRQLPTSPASMSHRPRSLKPPSEPECEMPLFGAGEQEATEAETDLEAGLEEAEVVSVSSQAGSRVGWKWPFYTEGWVAGWWGLTDLFSLELSWGGAFLAAN